MSKVAIIGNGGGGKSTLAIKLGKALRIGVHHIDRIQLPSGSLTCSSSSTSFIIARARSPAAGISEYGR
jgi:ABC-type transport system involved in cytochrome bd biosynthesis fused ATPase/permease subunit